MRVDVHYSCWLDQSVESQGGFMVMDIVFPVFFDSLPQRGVDCPFPDFPICIASCTPTPPAGCAIEGTVRVVATFLL